MSKISFWGHPNGIKIVKLIKKEVMKLPLKWVQLKVPTPIMKIIRLAFLCLKLVGGNFGKEVRKWLRREVIRNNNPNQG